MADRTRNTLKDLNDYLFQVLEELSDDGLSGSELEEAVKKAKAVSAVGTVIVRNADVVCRAAQFQIDNGGGNVRLPRMITGNPYDGNYLEED